MINKKTQNLVLAALFAALCCIGTMLSIPTPTGGYLHLGDSMVLLSGILLGPIYGGAAAGIGSMLSDLLLGYVNYAPATLIIKALAAIVAGFFFRYFSNTNHTPTKQRYRIPLCGVLGGCIVISGYLVYEAWILNLGMGAMVNILGNLVQSLFGILLSTVLFPFLQKLIRINN